MTNIIIAITGASGSIYGLKALEAAKNAGCTTHLIITEAGLKTISYELNVSQEEISAKSDYVYENSAIDASIASGSFKHGGMIIAPCSVNTMSSIAYGSTSNLITRAGDVSLKERRKLVLMFRETPLHLGHIKAMQAVTESGAIIAPPVPAFYNKPQTINDIVDNSVGRVLNLLGIDNNLASAWQPNK